jgi:UDP-N-acetylmuramoyl-tripeptide--D-alanyl-D-alanine ligase
LAVTSISFLFLISLVAFLFFAARRLLSYLHIFQQEEYDGRRFVLWLLRTRSIDKRASLAIVIVGLAELYWRPAAAIYFGPVAAALIFVTFAIRERDPQKNAKKALVLTGRAKRIFALAALIAAVIGAAVSLPHLAVWAWLVPIQLLPFCLVLANILLLPAESAIQRKFWLEAHGKLAELKPTVIGITGSFGKTSIKHILGHILETQAPTLITPGSVNTPMGIARVLREKLQSQHRFFVCEMGAYGRGSIERLCRLAPPDLAVISSIGVAHFERFKSLDVVADTKCELAWAAAANGGKAVINDQVLAFAAFQKFTEAKRALTIVVGAEPDVDLGIRSIRQTTSGIETDVDWKEQCYTIEAPLFGEHHAVNLALAFGAAVSLGVSIEHVLLSLKTVPQIKHRLEVKYQPDGAILIDDAYNSNPIGFQNGLSILDLLRRDNGRRILVTPGMAELGAMHNEEHRKIGELAGSRVDILVAVLPERIEELIGAYRAANANGTVVRCANFAQASDWLSKNLRSNDIALLENDLPDLYEAKPVF